MHQWRLLGIMEGIDEWQGIGVGNIEKWPEGNERLAVVVAVE